MSDRKQITASLSALTEKMISRDYDPRSYWSKEVTFDYGTPNPVRVDYMKFEPLNNSVSGIEKGDFYCYEIKSCEADFLSGHGLNFVGDYNYIVCPNELYDWLIKNNKLPFGVGVYAPAEDNSKLTCVKKARRKDRQRPVCEMLLMMLRSARRDVVKSKVEDCHD